VASIGELRRTGTGPPMIAGTQKRTISATHRARFRQSKQNSGHQGSPLNASNAQPATMHRETHHTMQRSTRGWIRSKGKDSSCPIGDCEQAEADEIPPERQYMQHLRYVSRYFSAHETQG
jgi:hypothetical protein